MWHKVNSSEFFSSYFHFSFLHVYIIICVPVYAWVYIHVLCIIIVLILGTCGISDVSVLVNGGSVCITCVLSEHWVETHQCKVTLYSQITQIVHTISATPNMSSTLGAYSIMKCANGLLPGYYHILAYEIPTYATVINSSLQPAVMKYLFLDVAPTSGMF